MRRGAKPCVWQARDTLLPGGHIDDDIEAVVGAQSAGLKALWSNGKFRAVDQAGTIRPETLFVHPRSISTN